MARLLGDRTVGMAVRIESSSGNGVSSVRIALPQWVLEEMDEEPNIAYSDRFGRRNGEYISLGCDILPVFHERSPIQAYADYMRNFRDTFRPFLGGIITGIQVGGPAGELRYPACPSQKLTWAWCSRELGEFQCYDKVWIHNMLFVFRNARFRRETDESKQQSRRFP